MPPPDLLSVGGQAVDIDLTLDDGDVAMAMSNPGDPSLGSSVDKPIELDLDDLFTEPAHQHLTSSGMPPSHVGSNSHPSEPQMSDIFNVLQTTPEPNATTTGTSGGMSSGDFSGMEQMFPSGTSSSLDMGMQGIAQTGDSSMNIHFDDLNYIPASDDMNMQELFDLGNAEGFTGNTGNTGNASSTT